MNWKTIANIFIFIPKQKLTIYAKKGYILLSMNV